MENPTVTLRDELGKSLNCYIEQSLEHDDSEYALLLPIDTLRLQGRLSLSSLGYVVFVA